MADQKKITLYPFNATPKNPVLRALPIADAAAITKIYLLTTSATPNNIIIRDPTAPPAQGGAITGILNATEGQDSADLAGVVATIGVLAATEQADTGEFEGVVAVVGDLSATEAADTADLAGSVSVIGLLAATEGPDTAAFAGGVAASTPQATPGYTYLEKRWGLFRKKKKEPEVELAKLPPEPLPQPLPKLTVLNDFLYNANIEAALVIERRKTVIAKDQRRAELLRQRAAKLETQNRDKARQLAEQAAVLEKHLQRLKEEDDFFLMAA